MRVYEIKPKNGLGGRALVVAKNRRDALEQAQKLTDLEIVVTASMPMRPTVLYCNILPF